MRTIKLDDKVIKEAHISDDLLQISFVDGSSLQVWAQLESRQTQYPWQLRIVGSLRPRFFPVDGQEEVL